MNQTVGMVMISAMPRKTTAGASVFSCEVLVPRRCSAPSAGIPTTTMPANIAAIISS